MLINLLKFLEKNLSAAIKNGTMKSVLNNELLKLMVTSIQYDSDES